MKAIERAQCFWVNIRHGVDIMRGLYLTRPDQRREGWGHIEVPAWSRFIRVWIAGPAFGFEQFWFCWAWHEWGWPEWPGLIATRIHTRIDDVLSRWDRSMQWNAPDGGLPNEVGFWSEDDGSGDRAPWRVCRTDNTTTIIWESASMEPWAEWSKVALGA